MLTDKKARAKSKCGNIQCKTYVSNLAENPKFAFTVKKSGFFLRLHFYNQTFPPQF